MQGDELSEFQWVQLATIIDAGIPIEQVSERFGLDMFEISQWVSVLTELESCVLIKTFSGAMTIAQMSADLYTAAELSLLGVQIVGRGVKLSGRVVFPCAPFPELDHDGEVVVVSMKKHPVYQVPDCVMRRLWELRPDPQEISVFSQADSNFMEMLINKLSVRLFAASADWVRDDLCEYRTTLMAVRVHDLTPQQRGMLRKNIIKVDAGQILTRGDE